MVCECEVVCVCECEVWVCKCVKVPYSGKLSRLNNFADQSQSAEVLNGKKLSQAFASGITLTISVRGLGTWGGGATAKM